MKNTQLFAIFCHTLIHRSYIPNLVNLGQILRIFTFGGSKNSKKALKNKKKAYFFPKSKKMRLPIAEEVLHSKFHVDISKIATCSLWKDKQTNRQTHQLEGVTSRNT